MHQKFTTKELVCSGLLLALGILLPMIFHSLGIMGKVFLPMHIPVLIGGFLLNPWSAFILGVITPLLSGAITGMPVLFPMAIIMAFELGVYGLIASLTTRKFNFSTIPSLIISMAAGRITAGFAVFILANTFGLKMNPIVFLKGAVTTGLPGIIIQLIFIPTLIYALKAFRKNSLEIMR